MTLKLNRLKGDFNSPNNQWGLAKPQNRFQYWRMDSTNIIPFPSRHPANHDPVMFQRRELNAIMRIYGQLVAAGEWRDYAIDMTRDAAIFSVFRRMGETPAYRIEKRPKNAAKQGAYSIVASDGQVLKRGSDLVMTLRIFNRKLMKLADKE